MWSHFQIVILSSKTAWLELDLGGFHGLLRGRPDFRNVISEEAR
jgi:hypothetical protein